MSTLVIGEDRWEFDLEKLLNVELMAVEKALGRTAKEWLEDLQSDDIAALTALVWIVRKRTEPTLQYSDTSFVIGDVDVVNDDDDPKDEAPDTPSSSELPPTSGISPSTSDSTPGTSLG